MLLWHLGASLWLFRWIFRDPKVDIRFLFLGAVLPDLVDLPIGTIWLADRFSTGELWSHSLVTVVAFMSLVLLLTRRGRKRRAWMALGIGWLLHLFLDAIWLHQTVFLWPVFGWVIPSGGAPFWSLAWERALSDPWRWAKEAVGLGYMMWLWFAVGINHPDRRRDVVRTGRLPGHVNETT